MIEASAKPTEKAWAQEAWALANGIDVSHWQNIIDWSMVKKHIDFAFLKCTQEAHGQDPSFPRNWYDCDRNQIPCGPYHFFMPKVSPASQQANFVATLNSVIGKPYHTLVGKLPPVIDFEVTQGMPIKEVIANLIQLAEGITSDLGIKPIIYTNNALSYDAMDPYAQLQNYSLWISHFYVPTPHVPKPWSTWQFWQFTNRGQVPGIKGNVDRNYFNGTHIHLQQCMLTPC